LAGFGGMRVGIRTFLRCGSYFMVFCIACLTELPEITEVSFGNQIFDGGLGCGYIVDVNIIKWLYARFLWNGFKPGDIDVVIDQGE